MGWHLPTELFLMLMDLKKIISILSDFKKLENCDVLEIGTGSGYISNVLSKNCKSMNSVDINDERLEKTGYQFKKINDENLPFTDNRFDIVISNHVIEHVPNQELHINEIYRVIKKNGILYLATPNKFWILEAHHKVPFIAFLPRKLSSIWLKILKNKEWDIYPLSFGMLKKLTRNKFELKNFTIDVIKNPTKYNLDIIKIIHPLLKRMPIIVIKMFNSFVPDYILILKPIKLPPL